MAKLRETNQRERYGIGEWYGQSFVTLTLESRHLLASASLSKDKPSIPCPFRSTSHHEVLCKKPGGVCTIRRYTQEGVAGVVSVSPEERGSLVTLCPHRFKEKNNVYSWIAQTLLGTPTPRIVAEVPFLKKDLSEEEKALGRKARHVGRIDNVLVHPTQSPLHWCAVEMQAVYFSGREMRNQFQEIHEWPDPNLPFPTVVRRPDYRSSGAKRLMPQLQTKVPRLRAWGKKLAVVVDRGFFSELGRMEFVEDVPSCEVAWFILTYAEKESEVSLQLDSVKLTTLESVVKGLTGGSPVTLQEFEEKIQEKLRKGYPSS